MNGNTVYVAVFVIGYTGVQYTPALLINLSVVAVSETKLARGKMVVKSYLSIADSIRDTISTIFGKYVVIPVYLVFQLPVLLNRCPRSCRATRPLITHAHYVKLDLHLS